MQFSSPLYRIVPGPLTVNFFSGECYGEYFEKSTLTLAITWCYQATSHYLNQSWPRSIASLNSSPPGASYMRQLIGSALIQITACCLCSAKPLSEPILGYYTPRFNEVERGYTGFILLVRLCVSGQNRVRSVSSTMLVGSISYLPILWSNFRRCVACKVCFKIKKFGKLFKFVTLTLSSFDLGSNMTQ